MKSSKKTQQKLIVSRNINRDLNNVSKEINKKLAELNNISKEIIKKPAKSCNDFEVARFDKVSLQTFVHLQTM